MGIWGKLHRYKPSHCIWISLKYNSLRSNDASASYIIIVEIMASHLLGASPLSKPIVPQTYCQFDTWNKRGVSTPYTHGVQAPYPRPVFPHYHRPQCLISWYHRSSVNSPHKGQWRGALMFSLICTRINGWVNNGDAGDLRRHGTHYDVTVMHCGDITCVEWHLKSPTTQHFVQTFFQANNK